MNSILRRRRGMMGVKAGDGKIWLYRNGVEYPLSGGFNFVGYSENSSVNKIEKLADSVHWYNTGNVSTGGGKSFTTIATLASEFIGKTVYVKGNYTISNPTSGSTEALRLYNSETVTTSYVFSTAYPNATQTTMHLNLNQTEFEYQITLTKAGYLSICFQHQTGTFEYSIYLKEVWIE